MSDKTIWVYVSTNKVGSRTESNTGITESEWNEMSDEDRSDIESQYVWEQLSSGTLIK